jgi:hypothetical protein
MVVEEKEDVVGGDGDEPRYVESQIHLAWSLRVTGECLGDEISTNKLHDQVDLISYH